MTRTRWILLAIVGLLSVLASMLFRGDLPAAEVDAKYSNDASRFLPMEDGARVHYRDEGNAAGAAVVLIHGAMASLHTWEPWVTILGQQYRVITLDLPAHGLTGQVPEHAYGADAFTETIHAVVNELGVERFVLGGNSMGGGATWRYVLAHPKRVRAMILVDSVPPGDWRESTPAAATEDVLVLPGSREPDRVRRFSSRRKRRLSGLAQAEGRRGCGPGEAPPVPRRPRRPSREP